MRLEDTPFLVFTEQGEDHHDDPLDGMAIFQWAGIECHIVRNATKVLEYADDCWVMAQWRGKTRSDWFRFTVKDLRNYAIAHLIAPPLELPKKKATVKPVQKIAPKTTKREATLL